MKRKYCIVLLLFLFACVEEPQADRIFRIDFKATGTGGGPYSVIHSFEDGQLPLRVDSIAMPYNYGFRTRRGSYGDLVQLTVTSENGGMISGSIWIDGEEVATESAQSLDALFISTKTMVVEIP